MNFISFILTKKKNTDILHHQNVAISYGIVAGECKVFAFRFINENLADLSADF